LFTLKSETLAFNQKDKDALIAGIVHDLHPRASSNRETMSPFWPTKTALVFFAYWVAKIA
jgi:hypothetical protein